MDNNKKANKRPQRKRKTRTAQEVRSDIAALGRVVAMVKEYVDAREANDHTFEPDGEYVITGTSSKGTKVSVFWPEGDMNGDPLELELGPKDLIDPIAAFEALKDEQRAEIAQMRALRRKYPDVDLDECED